VGDRLPFDEEGKDRLRLDSGDPVSAPDEGISPALESGQDQAASAPEPFRIDRGAVPEGGWGGGNDAPAPAPAPAADAEEREAYGRSLTGTPEEAPATESALSDHILGLDEDEPEEEPTGEATPELTQVRKFCRSLSKAVKAVRLYPVENPMCRRFADDLANRLTETFQLMDALRLNVGKTKLFYTGEPVLHQEARDDSVPARLFWDGIREITFHVGLTRREVLDFLTLFRKSALKVVEGEDDFVTLLWEGRFEHITHIAIDDILDLDNAEDPIPEEFGNEYMNYVDLEMHNLEDEEETERAANEIAEQVRAKIMAEEDPELFGISREEREGLLAEIAEEESSRILGDIVLLICETLFLEKDEASFVSLVQVLSGAMLGLIGEGRLREASEIIGMLHEVAEDRDDLTPGMSTVIDSGLRSAWDDTRCESLARHLDAGRTSAIAPLEHFIRVLPEEAIGSLCEVLGRLESPRARKRLVDALIEKAGGNILPFLPFLKDERWFLVRNVVVILGAMKNEQAVTPLKELLKHPEFRVRREALRALSQVGRGRALDVLVECLFDPDQRIRSGAARNLSLTGRRAVPHLLTVIEEKDFDNRDLSEKRSFYEALGYAGGKDMIPLMRDVLGRRSLFRRTQADELRACACEALGWIGGSEAQELLSRHLEERSIIVRTAAQSGLRRIAKGGDGESIVKEAA
jgi:hypothetical protein